MKYAELLKPGDTIGVISPSHVAVEADYQKIVKTIESLGFTARLGRNVFKNTYGYLASEQERADDFNDMAADSDVKMIFFGGGYGANEILPLIDYEIVNRFPKLFCSYSDGTNILNAVNAKTGLVTYYGLGAGEFRDLKYCDYLQFAAHFIEGRCAEFPAGCGNWRVVCPGVCEGSLAGGYLKVFAQQLGGGYFGYDPNRRYILFLEDHEKFGGAAAVSSFLAHIEQHDFIKQVCGLFFGHYSENVPPDLLGRLERFGKKHRVPVVYTDDFGHYTMHSILPIGVDAKLDTAAQTLFFRY